MYEYTIKKALESKKETNQGVGFQQDEQRIQHNIFVYKYVLIQTYNIYINLQIYTFIFKKWVDNYNFKVTSK